MQRLVLLLHKPATAVEICGLRVGSGHSLHILMASLRLIMLLAVLCATLAMRDCSNAAQLSREIMKTLRSVRYRWWAVQATMCWHTMLVLYLLHAAAFQVCRCTLPLPVALIARRVHM